MKKAASASPIFFFQHDALHSTSNKALQNAIRAGQL